MSTGAMAEFARLVDTPSDINEHLVYLRDLAVGLDHITEFGVRHGVSTTAWLAARPKFLRTFDKNEIPSTLRDYAQELGVSLWHAVGDVMLGLPIEQTDLLFIDTYHTYKQLKFELERYHIYVNKYIVLHDTFTFGQRGEDGLTPGLIQAVNEFVGESEWTIHHHTDKNNGLTVLTK